MDLELLKDIKCIVTDELTREMSFFDVMQLPTPKDGYNIILFTFPDDGEYYSKPYINECISSWRRKLVWTRLIFIPVFESKKISKWTEVTYHRKNFPTDSLRIAYTALLDRCLYIDTDVFFSTDFNVPFEKDCFVVSSCSGTFLWNKKRNNKKLLRWFNIYERVAVEIEKIKDRCERDNAISDHGDLNMYLIYGSKLKIETINDAVGVNHFSNIYPYMRDKKHLGISVNPPGSVASFHIDAFYAFSLYCYDRHYTDYISLCFYNPESHQTVGFYTKD